MTNQCGTSTAVGQQIRGDVEGAAMPRITDREHFRVEVERLRMREKAHKRLADEIAADRRRLPMVEVPADAVLIGPDGPTTLLAAFEGRRQLIAYYFMWHPGRPAAEQCEGCTWCGGQVEELAYLHSRDISYAVLCQGPYDESRRYRDFMGWRMPWYSAEHAVPELFAERPSGPMELICYLRDGDRVFETYWTTGRGVEVMDYNFALMDLTVYGRQETWEVSPVGWPQGWDVDGRMTTDGRPAPQWSRLWAGRSDDLGTGSTALQDGDQEGRGHCCHR
jgi:predicted dithiol-disulfide oxidoreductase (DUF899 family)